MSAVTSDRTKSLQMPHSSRQKNAGRPFGRQAYVYLSDYHATANNQTITNHRPNPKQKTTIIQKFLRFITNTNVTRIYNITIKPSPQLCEAKIYIFKAKQQTEKHTTKNKRHNGITTQRTIKDKKTHRTCSRH
jgi:hypothetical protein